MTDLAAITLAAGLGTRMRSKRAKVLHQIAGETMLARSLRPIVVLGASPIIVVVGNQADEVRAAAISAFPKTELRFALQSRQLGTGHAARCALPELPEDFRGDVLLGYGDLPAVTVETLRRFLSQHRENRAPVSFITFRAANPAAYGRVIRVSGQVDEIVEARDASPVQLKINEVNSGVYLVKSNFLRDALPRLSAQNAQGEYYLTDLVKMAREQRLQVDAFVADHETEFAGINSREELAQMESQVRNQNVRKLMSSGVTVIDPPTCYVGDEVEIGADTVIGPNVQIWGKSRIGSNVRIEGTAWLRDVVVGDRCHIKLGVRAEECHIGEDSDIGPFANLRAGTELEGHNRVGNFVETKKARLGRGAKASHLSYLGDTTIGSGTNIGCGVITVNYDGYDKHETLVGDRCMVGCDTQFVAPVKIGSDVYVASGTTIIRDVPDGSLVMSHHPQREKAGWMAGFHKRHAGRKPWWEK